MKLNKLARRCATALPAAVAAFGLMSPEAFAASGSDDFSDLWDMLEGWSQGSLGKSISLMFLLVGLGVGVVRGSIIGAVGCVAAAIALFLGPQIVETIFSAVI